MKKSFFDRKLYREGLRQLRVMGIAFLSAYLGLILLNLLVPALKSSSGLGSVILYRNLSPRDILTGGSLSFMLVAPFLALSAFSFTTKRSSSDFYHAIPQTRSCLFFSLYGACVSWLVMILTAGSLLGGCIAALFPKYYGFSPLDLFLYTLALLAISLYVMAFTALASSLSGHLFGQFCLALLMLFGPRIAGFSLASIVTDSTSFMVNGHLTWPLDVTNLFTLYCYSFMGSGNLFFRTDGQIFTLFKWLYTMGAALLWTGVAVFAFCRRKSEYAESFMASRRVRTCFSLGISFLFCMVPLNMLFENTVIGAFHDAVDIVHYYFYGLLAYFVVELLCVRNLRKLQKALPGLLILVALNLAAFGGMLLMRHQATAYRPGAEEVAYVRIASGGSAYSDYFETRAASNKLENPAIKELLTKVLNRNREEKLMESYRSYSNERQIMAVFKTGLQEHYRWILLTETEMSLLNTLLSQDPAFREAYTDLPAYEELDYLDVTSFDQEDARQLYELLREEVKEIGFEAWREILQGMYYGAESPLGTLHASAPLEYNDNDYYGVSSYSQSMTLPIVTQLPKCYKLYTELSAMALEKGRQQVLKSLKSLEAQTMEGSLFIYAYDGKGSFWSRDFYCGPGQQKDDTFSLSSEEIGMIRSSLADNSMFQGPGEQMAYVQIEIYGGPDRVYGVFYGDDLPGALLELLKEKTASY